LQKYDYVRTTQNKSVFIFIVERETNKSATLMELRFVIIE